MSSNREPGMYNEPRTDGRAIGSLICGILGLTILSILAGIPAIILGHISRSEIRKSAGQLKGEGMALAGLIMGYISLAIIPVIIIIAAIAIPTLLRSRTFAHEAAAIATLRTINTAEGVYKSFSNGKFGRIEDLIEQNLVPSNFTGTVSGYNYSVTTSQRDYSATAEPASPAEGRYGYFITSDGEVRYSNAYGLAPAGAAGQPVGR